MPKLAVVLNGIIENIRDACCCRRSLEHICCSYSAVCALGRRYYDALFEPDTTTTTTTTTTACVENLKF